MDVNFGGAKFPSTWESALLALKKVCAGSKSFFNLKSATKPFNLLLACTCPLVTEFADIVKSKWFEKRNFPKRSIFPL